MTDLFLTVVNMSIASSWLIIAAVFARRFLKKRSLSMMFILWGLIALRLVLPINIVTSVGLVPESQFVTKDIYSDRPLIRSGITALDEGVGKIGNDINHQKAMEGRSENIRYTVPKYSSNELLSCNEDNDVSGVGKVRSINPFAVISAVWITGVVVIACGGLLSIVRSEDGLQKLFR